MEQGRLIVSEEEIQGLVARMSGEINRFYGPRKGEQPVLVLGILNGAFIFLADLVRKLTFTTEIEFIRVSSYGTALVSSGNVRILYEPAVSLEGRDVLVVDELIDTGRTLEAISGYCREKGARSVVTAVLLDKFQRREVDYHPDFIGRTIENTFVCGYGLDGGGYYRQYPAVYDFSKKLPHRKTTEM